MGWDDGDKKRVFSEENIAFTSMRLEPVFAPTSVGGEWYL